MSLTMERRGDVVEVFDLKTLPRPQQVQNRFAVTQQNSDRHVVVPDIHGEYRVLEKIVDRYIDEPDVDFVFLGDLIDRKGVIDDPEKGVYKTLAAIKELGSRAIVTMANHEWYLHASTSAKSLSLKADITEEWLGAGPDEAIERNVLVSYGIDPFRRDGMAMEQLRRRMAKVGHLAILTNATPYFETDTFIATHAGVMPDASWEVQRNYLTEVGKEMNEGLFYDRPPQWFSMRLATSTAPIYHTDKTVVSGHAHVLNGKHKQDEARSLHEGRRIRLASTLNAPTGAPAFIWQDWDGEIVEIPRD